MTTTQKEKDENSKKMQKEKRGIQKIHRKVGERGKNYCHFVCCSSRAIAAAACLTKSRALPTKLPQ